MRRTNSSIMFLIFSPCKNNLQLTSCQGSFFGVSVNFTGGARKRCIIQRKTLVIYYLRFRCQYAVRARGGAEALSFCENVLLPFMLRSAIFRCSHALLSAKVRHCPATRVAGNARLKRRFFILSLQYLPQRICRRTHFFIMEKENTNDLSQLPCCGLTAH